MSNPLQRVWAIFLALSICWTSSIYGQQDEFSKLQQAGQPLSIKDLKPKDISKQDNGAAMIKDVSGSVLEIDMAFAESFEFDQPASAEFVHKFDELVAKNPGIFAQLKLAAEAPKFQLDLNFNLKPQEFVQQISKRTVQFRSIGRVLLYRSKVQLARGDRAGAVATANTILKIGQRFGENTGLIGYLTSLAVKGMGLHQINMIMQSGDLKPETRTSIESELARLDTLQPFHPALVSERAIGLSMLKDQGLTVAIFRIEPYLKTVGKAIENCQKTIYEQRQIVDDTGMTAAMILPAIEQSRGASNRVLAQVRALRIINALQGSMANEPTLESLDLPKTTKIDPYSGDPMIVFKSESGWTVYSIGRNLKDDEGTFEPELDFGFGPR